MLINIWENNVYGENFNINSDKLRRKEEGRGKKEKGRRNI